MSDDWPAWATARIEVVPPDPAWGEAGRSLAADVDGLLGGVAGVDGRALLAGATEHVGSTAVPGLASKPVLDLLSPVASLDAAPSADGPLGAAGWELVPPELDGRPWRRMYVLPDGDRRLAHLHLVERTHARWGQTLAFRDALRADPAAAARYAAVKQQAARAHGEDREAYTEAKSAFVAEIVARYDPPSA